MFGAEGLCEKVGVYELLGRNTDNTVRIHSLAAERSAHRPSLF
jgi:hypothetical protein